MDARSSPIHQTPIESIEMDYDTSSGNDHDINHSPRIEKTREKHVFCILCKLRINAKKDGTLWPRGNTVDNRAHRVCINRYIFEQNKVEEVFEVATAMADIGKDVDHLEFEANISRTEERRDQKNEDASMKEEKGKDQPTTSPDSLISPTVYTQREGENCMIAQGHTTTVPLHQTQTIQPTMQSEDTKITPLTTHTPNPLKRSHQSIEIDQSDREETEDDAARPKRRKSKDEKEDTEAHRKTHVAALPHAIASYPTISFHCLQRAQKTIEDFIRTYLFIFHAETDEMAPSGIPDSSLLQPSTSSLHLMFRLLPLLTFVSGTIYQLDEENEERNAARRARHGEQQKTPAEHKNATDELACTSYDVLCDVLRSQGFLTNAVLTELQKGKIFWQLETDLCDQLTRGIPIKLPDVHTASSCKSFDYRVLNLVVYGFRGVEPDQNVLSALRLNEQLVDIHDDLCDYEDDIQTNSFNIYRMYVRLFGSDAPIRLMARIQQFESSFAKAIELIPPTMRAKFEARERAAMKEYGREGQDGSRWIIPRPIVDEAAFLRECQEAEAQSRQLEDISTTRYQHALSC